MKEHHTRKPLVGEGCVEDHPKEEDHRHPKVERKGKPAKQLSQAERGVGSGGGGGDGDIVMEVRGEGVERKVFIDPRFTSLTHCR